MTIGLICAHYLLSPSIEEIERLREQPREEQRLREAAEPAEDRALKEQHRREEAEERAGASRPLTVTTTARGVRYVPVRPGT